MNIPIILILLTYSGIVAVGILVAAIVRPFAPALEWSLLVPLTLMTMSVPHIIVLRLANRNFRAASDLTQRLEDVLESQSSPSGEATTPSS
ncbi:MAG: hypothetical protein AB8F26_02375 [Phycisphaerales bacterium]